MKPKPAYRLPDGQFTSSAAKYHKEWRRLAEGVAEILDCTLLGYNPDIVLLPKGSGWSFSLPSDIAQRIINIEQRLVQCESRKTKN